MIKLFFTFIVILLSFSVVHAQQAANNDSKKVVLVNELAFYDKETGIKKLVEAENIAVNQGFNSEKDEQKRKESYERTYKKRHEMFVQPVLNEISDSLRKLENENNLIILQGAALAEKGQLLAFDEKFDITKQFIAFFNDKSTKSGETVKLDIPVSKIGVIDISAFIDEKSGIKKYLEAHKSKNYSEDVLKKIFVDIAKAMQTFSEEKEFSVIFDSSANLPAEIKNLKIVDATQEFISYFNNK